MHCITLTLPLDSTACDTQHACADMPGKPAQTSNGMYINPLSARAKQKRQVVDSSKLMTESSMMDDGNTPSGMISHQQGVGLQSEYRLKSFSAAVAKAPSKLWSTSEPKVPKVWRSNRTFFCLEFVPAKDFPRVYCSCGRIHTL
jgi:hypothetical protein